MVQHSLTMACLCFCGLLACLTVPAEAATILVYPWPWRSRMFDLLKVAHELAQRNHTVVALLPDSLAEDSHNLLRRIARSQGSGQAGLPPGLQIQLYKYTQDVEKFSAEMVNESPMSALPKLLKAFVDVCDDTLSDENAMQALRELKADLFLGDLLSTCTWVLSDALRLPRVEFGTGAGGAAVESLLHHHHIPLAIAPAYASGLPPNGMTFLQRCQNVAVYGALQLCTRFFSEPLVIELRQKHNITWPGPSMRDMQGRTLLTLGARDWGVEYPRPAPPLVKDVGPLAPEPAQPLPSELEAFVAGAGPAGVVLVSMGSHLQLLRPALEGLARALAALPQRVVWKLSQPLSAAAKCDSSSSSPSSAECHPPLPLGNNTLAMRWIPQNDLLGHPSTAAFVMHGGIHGMYEAAYHGVPTVVIPLGNDQPDNAATMEARGMGIGLGSRARAELAAGDASAVLRAVRKVTEEPSYRANARKLSRRMQAHPRRPVQQATDWVEYALGLGPGSEAFLTPLEARMPWHQFAMLDVAAFFAVAGAAVLWVVWRGVVWVLRRSLAALGLVNRKGSEKLKVG